MPTGTCNYPDHHSPSGGGPAALVAAVIAGAAIVAFWHAVLVVMAVVVVLLVVTGGVVVLWHSHTAAPYDAAWEQPEAGWRSQASTVRAEVTESRPAEIHQHLHIHVASAAEAAAIIASRTAERHEIESSFESRRI